MHLVGNICEFTRIFTGEYNRRISQVAVGHLGALRTYKEIHIKEESIFKKVCVKNRFHNLLSHPINLARILNFHSYGVKMKITVKDIHQRTVQVDVNTEDTVGQLKQAIQTSLGDDYEASKQKLIYAGRILADNNGTLKDYSIEERGFVVVITPNREIPFVSAANSVTTPSATDTTVVPTTPFASAINQIIELGYSRTEATEAIERAAGSTEQAIEYLLGELPFGGGGGAAVASNSSSATLTSSSTETMISQHPVAAENKLAFLRNDPQFLEMRRIVQSDASALRDCIGQIALSNPDLFVMITTNQQDFIDLLNEGVVLAAPPSLLSLPPELPPTLSSADRNAIERLKELGFVERDVMEAYLVCERDENRAAEFLLNHIDE